MADLTQKKSAYVARLIGRVSALLDDIKELDALRNEWGDMGYAGGDQPAPPEGAIVDADLTGFPHLSAADANAAIAALDGLKASITSGAPSARALLQRLRP